MSELLLQNQEKRKAKRLLTEELFVVIEDQINMTFASLDYNAMGMAILIDLDLQVGEEISITIGNDDGFLIPDIPAIIRNKSLKEETEEYRYGLEFDYESRMTENVKDKLKRLEKILS